MRGRAAAALAACALTAGCGGDGTVGMMEPPPGSDAATLTEIQNDVFTPRCALPGCHAAPAPEQGMDLSAGHAHGAIVGVASAELAPYLRVAPGDGASSYVLMKLAGDPRIVGERMPFGGPYLTEAEIERVRSWIDAGALDN